MWGQVIDKEFLSDFESTTGIHVNVSYLENNEELFVKLRHSENHDYDMVMPSDWAAQLLIKNGLIKKIDRAKIDAWDNLYPALCNQYFDPGNLYTVPFYWSLFGIAVDTRYCGNSSQLATWGLIFDENFIPGRIATVEDSRALILTAALYLFGPHASLGVNEIDNITQLLIRQKPYVEIYTDLRAEYVLASGMVHAAVGLSGDFLKIMRQFDYIDFIVPREGCFAVIDSCALTATTKKDDLVYQFLRYLLQPDIVKKYVDKFDFFPAVKIKVEYDDRFVHCAEPTEALFKNINFFNNILSKDTINDVLIALKA